AAVVGARLAADPEARTPAGRARAGRPVHDRLHRPLALMASPMREKNANRRIRLLLAIFAVVFAAMLARAVWLQGVQAAHLSSLAKNQHEETQTIPAGRGTIFDRTGVQLAIGEQKTTVYADPAMVQSPRAIALAAHEAFGVDPNVLLPELLN